MTGLKKFDGKERRKQRRNNHIAKDLMSPKYRQRIVEKKRVEDEFGNYYLQDRYLEDDDDDYGSGRSQNNFDSA